MKLTFLGTRGKIEPESERHRRHTSLLVGYRGREVMIDCGDGWEAHLDGLRPPAILLTHAHSDHVGGLRDGAPCPVWATERTWREIDDVPVAEEERRVVEARRPFEVSGIRFEAFPVLHSVRAPAVGYRIAAGRVTIFYAPDVARIESPEGALEGCRLYVGDGATVDGHLLRRSEGELIGHAAVRSQLGWCREHGVERMIVTHCGSQIVRGEREDPDRLAAKIDRYADEAGVEVEIAFDGMERIVR